MCDAETDWPIYRPNIPGNPCNDDRCIQCWLSSKHCPTKYRDGASQISGGYFRIVSNVLLRNSPWMSLCVVFSGGGATRSIPVHFSLAAGIGSCWFMLICAAYIHRVFLVQTAILDLNLVENPGLAALKNSCVRWLPYKQFMFGLVIIQWHETNTFFSSKRWR